MLWLMRFYVKIKFLQLINFLKILPILASLNIVYESFNMFYTLYFVDNDSKFQLFCGYNLYSMLPMK